LVIANEFPNDYKNLAKNISEVEGNAWAFVCKNRSDHLRSAFSQLDVNDIEAETLWGKPIDEKVQQIRKLLKQL